MSSISGFPEFLPAQQILFEQWKKKIISHFESFSFIPLETPAVERMKTLLAKGDDHEIYVLERYGESRSTQELGLRFDLTVPLARYVSGYHGQLVFPYRRYHIAPVWRGERPQEGRYRQFYQCDIDVINTTPLSLWQESELVFMMHKVLNHLDIPVVLGPVKWHISHRSLLETWVARSGLTSCHEALRIIDKRGKVSFDQILHTLKDQGANAESLTHLERWSLEHESWESACAALRQLSWGADFDKGLQEIEQILTTLTTMGIPSSCLSFDPLLARGLSYYSGTVYEATLLNHPSLGAISAGGRYDHLTKTLSSKHTFPGVGLSLGLSRLFSLFLQHTPTALRAGDVLITTQEPLAMLTYIALGENLRDQGLKTQVYLEAHPLPHQLKYAHRNGFPFVIIANGEELEHQSVHLKSMVTGEQECVAFSDIATRITQGC